MAVLTYPTVPRFSVTIVAVVPSTFDPILHNDCRNTEDNDDNRLVVSKENDDKLLIVEGIPFIIGPPARVSVERVSIHVVPPSPFVIKTLPVEIKSPVFESRANTLRRTVVSDIALSLLDRKALRELPSLRIIDRIR